MKSKEFTVRHRKKECDNKIAKFVDDKKERSAILSKATRLSTHRIWTRSVMIFAVTIIVYFYSKKGKEVKFALYKENIQLRLQKFPCSSTYLTEIQNFRNCLPSTCGRFVTDVLVDQQEANILLDIAKKGINLGGSAGGASILDLHSGALSKDEHFINVHQLPEAVKVFQNEHLITYKMVKSKIKQAIADKFGIAENSLYLTYPTFFSRITNDSAKTIHDEYWHPHVDKETYESFHYTSLLYLANYGKDFSGGRFIFIDGSENNQTQSFIEPKKGRVIVFTSGEENLHHVEKVLDGTRYAITISFTCNPEFEIDDPKFITKDPADI